MRNFRLISVVVLLPLVFGPVGRSDTPQPTNQKPRYEYRDEHDPDGIGKFYMGREIAQVMGHQAIGWLERPERLREETPSKMIEALQVKAGQTVADVGAGSGYHTLRLSPKVGAKGKVYAVDVQPEMLAAIRRKIRAKKIANVEVLQGTQKDPKLPKNALDLILLVDVYHEFEYPHEMTTALVEALKPGGRLVFVEFRMEDMRVPIKLVHKMSEKQVRKEMGPHPLRWTETIGGLPWQHIIVFEKQAEKKDETGK